MHALFPSCSTGALFPSSSSGPKIPLPDASEYVRYSTALLVTVGLGVSLLLLNGLIFLLLFWRRPSQHPPCQGHHLHAQVRHRLLWSLEVSLRNTESCSSRKHVADALLSLVYDATGRG